MGMNWTVAIAMALAVILIMLWACLGVWCAEKAGRHAAVALTLYAAITLGLLFGTVHA